MATSYFVDPVSGNDTTGTGLIGAPWKTMQKALTTATPIGTGIQINLKDSGPDVLAASLTWSATPTISLPLIIRGYTSAENDGGIGEIDGNSVVSTIFSQTSLKTYVCLIDLNIHHTTGITVDAGTGWYLENCWIHHGTNLFDGGANNRVYRCAFSDSAVNQTSVDLALGCSVNRCFIYDTLGTGASNGLIKDSAGGDCMVFGCILFIDGGNTGSSCIFSTGPRGTYIHNTFVANLSSATSVRGIYKQATGSDNSREFFNVFQGFNTSGSIGVSGLLTTAQFEVAGPDHFHDCTTNRTMNSTSICFDNSAFDTTGNPGLVDPTSPAFDFTPGEVMRGTAVHNFGGSPTTSYAEMGAVQLPEAVAGGADESVYLDESLHPIEDGIIA